MSAIAKAVTAFLVSGYALYQVATVGTSPGGEGVTANEWVAVVVTGVISGLAVWLIPNTPKEPVD